MKFGIRKTTLIMSVLSILLLSLASSGYSDEPNLQELAQIESRIKNVVREVMPTVVAVTDGEGFGSGVIVSENGLVLTAGHVMASPLRKNYEVIFPSGQRVKAVPLGKNLNVDAGMIQIVEEGTYPFSKVGEGQPRVGDWVVTLGHSGGYDLGRNPPVRTGRVLRQKDHQLVTDAVLIGGDSGGPLFNLDGEVIAIHSSIGDSIAENRHVTIDTFRRHWTRMAAGESWGNLPELSSSKRKNELPHKRARLGVGIGNTGESVGALVTRVVPNSPAEKAGIVVGDIIVRFDYRLISNSDELIELIKTKKIGQSYRMEVKRNGYYFNVQVVLDDF
ncbi:MAG: trypsin-like peptidase domain-containing protein [Planctomycetota bacterium]